MTKADLTEEVSRVVEITRREADGVEIRGFGSFRTRQRGGRIGRNPKTGEEVDVPLKKIAFFKPSKDVQELVNPNERG